jgi:hypothetical protein
MIRHRVRFLLTALFVACTVLGASPAGAQGQREMLNVKDFGAIGNGGADDTQALQAAFDAQRQPPYHKVYFPQGHYKISDTVRMYSPNLYTEGATITQTDPTKDIFYIEHAWRGRVANFTFNGGKKQLNMRNIRVDQGLLFVDHCSFNKSTDFAIYMEERSNPMHLMVQDCHFNQCAQVLHTVCDWTTFTGGWITTAWMENRAAIEHRGAKLLLENVVGVPLVTGRDDRWIDNYGSLTCRNVRFGGEFGGMTPVWNYSRALVLMEDCYIGAQGSGKMAAVWCEEIPGHFAIRDCTLTVPPLMLSPKIDLKTYFNHIPDGEIQFDLERNTGTYSREPIRQLVQAAAQRDTSPLLKGQLSPEATARALNHVAEKVRALPPEEAAPAESNGHRQKTDPKDYVELTQNAQWRLDANMDATAIKNSEVIAAIQVGDDSVFMRRYGPQDGGTWPHAELHNVIIDLDQTPIISWKQKDPGPNPLPDGVVMRDEQQRFHKLDDGIAMPLGYALRIRDEETQRMVLLKEMHTPPWTDYNAKDLRKLFEVQGGKRTFTIKFYPLGVYITGMPGSGFAVPGEYQILDFIRAERE